MNCLLALLANVAAFATDLPVRTAAEFRATVPAAKAGDRILLAPGNYGGGFFFTDLHGEAGQPIVIAAADPAEPPVFSDAKEGLHLSVPAFVELHDLVFEKLTDNGLNIDDGGKVESPAHDVVLSRLRVRDIGTKGNQDGIKLSGLTDFRVEACVIERWGGGGSAIDLVGCHRGAIERCEFRHSDATGASGVQCKGGSSELAIRRNRFDHAGERAVNLGGSTGRPFFRPAWRDGEPHAEARDLIVEGNTFIGSLSPIAFVGVDGAIVRFNTFDRPARWVVRILQENRAADFVPCRRGEFSDNLVIFASAASVDRAINVGSATAPETFSFARNAWFSPDSPGRSRPKLPVAEIGGLYGREPAGVKAIAGAEALPK